MHPRPAEGVEPRGREQSTFASDATADVGAAVQCTEVGQDGHGRVCLRLTPPLHPGLRPLRMLARGVPSPPAPVPSRALARPSPSSSSKSTRALPVGASGGATLTSTRSGSNCARRTGARTCRSCRPSSSSRTRAKSSSRSAPTSSPISCTSCSRTAPSAGASRASASLPHPFCPSQPRPSLSARSSPEVCAFLECEAGAHLAASNAGIATCAAILLGELHAEEGQRSALEDELAAAVSAARAAKATPSPPLPSPPPFPPHRPSLALATLTACCRRSG